MGGCATKPKVLKGEAASEAPVPAPEAAAKEEVEAVAVVDDHKAKEKDVVLVAESGGGGVEAEKKIELGEEDDKVKEIVDDDEQGSKRRSLSLLFKNDEGKEESTEKEKPSETEKPQDEQGSTPDTIDVVDPPKKASEPADIAIEAAPPASETPMEHSSEKKAIEEVKEIGEATTEELKGSSAENSAEEGKDVQVKGDAEGNAKV